MEDDLYIENFYHSKSSSKLKSPVLQDVISQPTSPPETSKLEQKTLCLWLLKEEINKRFPHSFPLQKLLKQIEEGFSSHSEQVVKLLDDLEELVEVMERK